jgi:hypothetical protein
MDIRYRVCAEDFAFCSIAFIDCCVSCPVLQWYSTCPYVCVGIVNMFQCCCQYCCCSRYCCKQCGFWSMACAQFIGILTFALIVASDMGGYTGYATLGTLLSVASSVWMAILAISVSSYLRTTAMTKAWNETYRCVDRRLFPPTFALPTNCVCIRGVYRGAWSV